MKFLLLFDTFSEGKLALETISTWNGMGTTLQYLNWKAFYGTSNDAVCRMLLTLITIVKNKSRNLKSESAENHEKKRNTNRIEKVPVLVYMCVYMAYNESTFQKTINWLNLKYIFRQWHTFNFPISQMGIENRKERWKLFCYLINE